MRLIWPAGADAGALAEQLRATRLFAHVEGEPSVRERTVEFHQSATITDPLVTNTSIDPHRWQWAIDQANFRNAFGFTEGRVLVGVPDQGINPSHPDLLAAQRPHQRAALVRYTVAQPDDSKQGAAEIGFFPQSSQLNGDLGGASPQYAANVGHGLHVAGLIAAGKNNGEGGVGGCPGCGLATIRFIDAALFTPALQALGASFGVSAISMSFATPEVSQLQMDTVAALNERDVVLVASLGNGGNRIAAESQFGPAAFPAYVPFVIGVGGTDSVGERWHEHKVASRPLIRRHPQLWREAVLSYCALQMNGLGLAFPNEQWLPVNPQRAECGSNWGRQTFAAPFAVSFPSVGITIFPAGNYGLDVMAPAAQVLAPIDRTYSRYLIEIPLWPNAVLRPFPCWFAPTPECEWTLPGQNTAPNTNRIANAGVPMGPNAINADFQEFPRNEALLGFQQYGTMTGTSMAAPLVAAAAGLMRSANPLIRAAAVHDTLRCTATTMTNSEVWSGDPTLNPNPIINATIRAELTGNGRLNAEAAVRRTLGTVGGQTLRNRLIPMFSMGTSPDQSPRGWLYTTSPQVAMSGMTGELHRLTDPSIFGNSDALEYDSDGLGPFPLVQVNPLPTAPANDVGTSGAVWYSAGFVEGIGDQIPANLYNFPGNWIHVGDLGPSASFFVFSTPYNLLTATANGLVPLHRMSAKCNQFRKHFYTTSQTERTSAQAGPDSCVYSSSLSAQGFNDEGIEGYVFAPTAAQPPGTLALYRGWLAATESFVLITADELSLPAYSGAQFLTHLGWVYPAVKYSPLGTTFIDSDGDGLPDAFENLIGLDSGNADTDGDGRADGAELPFAAPGVSDPLIPDTVVACVP